ncbi:MAG: hypothetical protein AAGI23_07755 [Bacteroidota bacterium]
MNASYIEAISKLIQMHLDSSNTYQKVIHDIDFEELSNFFADFHKKHKVFADRLQQDHKDISLEEIVEYAPISKREDELFIAARENDEFKVYQVCLDNERHIMKCYEDALTTEDNAQEGFQKNLDTIATIVRRLERAKMVPAVKNVLVDL